MNVTESNEINGNVEVIESNEIFAAFARRPLIFPDSDEKMRKNQRLSGEIEKWIGNQCNKDIKVFLATLLLHSGKDSRADFENLLLYNLYNLLNNKSGLNRILSKKPKIIIQGVDHICYYKDFPYYYFYFVCDNLNSAKEYLLYRCNCDDDGAFSIKKEDLNDLKSKIENKTLAGKYNKYLNRTIVPSNTKFCLKIKVDSESFPYTLEKLKKLIDEIVSFANSLNIIGVPKGHKILNKRGLNPTDHLLYYCEIEELDNSSDYIHFCVSSICNNCTLYNNIKNFPKF